MRPARQHMRIAHELGHFALERHGLDDTEDGARYVGGALLLPRRAMHRDLVETAWSITKLQKRHEHASATAIAIRITQLRDAVATVFDLAGHRKPWRRASSWITDARIGRVSKFERDLAHRALEAGCEVRGDELCYAVPVVEGNYSQVIVVCELEQLSLRL